MKPEIDYCVEFDEFSRTCDLVEEYFGETLNEVALDGAISRLQLVAVLARAQLCGRQLTIDGFEDSTEIVYQSNGETLFWLNWDFWTGIRDSHNLEPEETRAAREAHRRLIEAIDGDITYYNRKRDPFLLIESHLE